MSTKKAAACPATAKLFRERKTPLTVLEAVKTLYTKYPERWVRGVWHKGPKVNDQSTAAGDRTRDQSEYVKMYACQHCVQGACFVMADSVGTAYNAIRELDSSAAELYNKGKVSAAAAIEVNDNSGKGGKGGRVAVLKLLDDAIARLRAQKRANRKLAA